MAEDKGRVGRRTKRETLAGVLYVGPAALVLGVFFLFPVCYALYVSLHRWGFVRYGYVGLANYQRALTDPEFGRSLAVTVTYVLGTVPVSIVLGLVFASLLSQRIRGRGIYRTIYFLPYVTSVVAAAAVWLWLLYPAPAEWGLANNVLRGLGIPAQGWIEESRGVFHIVGEGVGVHVPEGLGGPSLALVCVMLFSVWHSVGFDIVILLAALTAVPREIYEAAAIDGATRWKRLRHVTIPLISPTLFFLLIISTIRAFRVFGHIYVLADKDTQQTAHNVTMFIYRTFYQDNEVGYGSAAAMLLFLIILLVTLVQMRVVGRRVHY
ncbi:sugar ABC transporter permease [bacterium]|nr:sugar ABC transporter permease [bacterium]